MRESLNSSLACILSVVFLCSASHASSRTDKNCSAYFCHAAKIQQLADKIATDSREKITRSNNLRKQVLRFHKHTKGSAASQTALQELTKNVTLWAEAGEKDRAYAKQLHTQALELFSLGMDMLWPHSSNDKLHLDQKHRAFNSSHNGIVRSTHPNKPAQKVTLTQKSEMQIQLGKFNNQNTPSELNQSRTAISAQTNYVARISSTNTIPLNQIHQWTLHLSDTNGKPISGAKLRFEGHMPGHVHGMPTQPQVHYSGTEGVYYVKGIKFQMQGWWVVDFKVAIGDNEDSLRFNLSL